MREEGFEGCSTIVWKTYALLPKGRKVQVPCWVGLPERWAGCLSQWLLQHHLMPALRVVGYEAALPVDYILLSVVLVQPWMSSSGR